MWMFNDQITLEIILRRLLCHTMRPGPELSLVSLTTLQLQALRFMPPVGKNADNITIKNMHNATI